MFFINGDFSIINHNNMYKCNSEDSVICFSLSRGIYGFENVEIVTFEKLATIFFFIIL